MAFYTLQPMEPAFSSPISAFFKAFVMMLGEYQFEDYITIEKVTLQLTYEACDNFRSVEYILL